MRFEYAPKEVSCDDCGNFQPLIEQEPRTDDQNPTPWYHLTCATCGAVIAKIQSVPDEKPPDPPL